MKIISNFDFSPHELRHSHVNVVLYKVTHNKIVTELGEVHGCVLVFGQNVAVSPVLQQEAHYVSVPPFASLTQESNFNLRYIVNGRYNRVWSVVG